MSNIHYNAKTGDLSKILAEKFYWLLSLYAIKILHNQEENNMYYKFINVLEEQPIGKFLCIEQFEV